ncbi:MAG: carboxylating nicotinate-nucleotide diphosphorylase [Flavobacteriales bacterium]
MFEDVRDGDHTSLACISNYQLGSAYLLVKEPGILAGMQIAEKVFQKVDPSLKFIPHLFDGELVKSGDIAFEVQGPTLSILTAERLVLNLMQRMSGIATVTAMYAKAIAHTKAKVLDTRKTTPGIRMFEKQAVLIGGGQNHRFGLYDMILIKDNHVDAAGGINQAVNRSKAYLTEKGLSLNIEVEVRSLRELGEALKCEGIDRIMLDNFSVEQTVQAVEMVNGRCELESSGGITLETIVAYAETGVDYISVGALTHSVKSLDLSLKLSK